MVYRVPHRVSQKALIRGPGGMPLPLITPRYLAGTRVSEDLGGVVAAVPVTITQEDLEFNEPDQNVYTFSDAAFGTEAASRKLVIGLSFSKSNSTSTVTAGGDSCSLIRLQEGASSNKGELWYVDKATGTSGDIVVTGEAGNYDRLNIVVWNVTGAAAGAPIANDGDGSTASATITATVTIPANGGAVGCGGVEAATSWTWTNLTEGFDTGEANASPTGALVVTDTLLTNRLITATPATGAKRYMLVAAFAPA